MAEVEPGVLSPLQPEGRLALLAMVVARTAAAMRAAAKGAVAMAVEAMTAVAKEAGSREAAGMVGMSMVGVLSGRVARKALERVVVALRVDGWAVGTKVAGCWAEAGPQVHPSALSEDLLALVARGRVVPWVAAD